MNKRIKKKHYDLQCKNVELDELCWDYLQFINASGCSNSIRKQRRCPHYFPYRKSKRWWRKFKEFGMKRYAKECLKCGINKNI